MGQVSLGMSEIVVPAGGEAVALLPGCRICAHFERYGAFETDSLWAWTQAITPGKTAVDVGAYSGIYAISAALRGARVVAMEPMNAQRTRLRENVRLNSVEAAVRIMSIAATDTVGVMTLWHNPRIGLTSGASVVKGAGQVEHPVFGAPIDELQLTDVCVMKFDVERHEVRALIGAAETIKRCRPVLLVECLEGESRDAILNVLPGYRLSAMLDGRNMLLKPDGD